MYTKEQIVQNVLVYLYAYISFLRLLFKISILY